MQLLTFSPKLSAPSQDEQRVGLLLPQQKILDLQLAASQSAATAAKAHHFQSMLQVIQGGEEVLSLIRTLTEKPTAKALLSMDSIRILSPLPRPTSMRDGYAFRQHVQTARRNRGLEMIPEFDQFPVFYFTNHQAVTGPGPVAVMPQHLDKLDFELEMAMVVGKKGRNIPASLADEYIFGYCIMNDWSARTLQMEEMKLSLGPAKGKDFATSLGPYLVPSAALNKYSSPKEGGKSGLQYRLGMRAFVNGKQVSQGNVMDMTWTFAQILERVSYGVDVYPGDVIGSGTVGTGCFLELNGSKITDNQWLKVGDHCALEIDQLGRLENTIIAAE